MTIQLSTGFDRFVASCGCTSYRCNHYSNDFYDFDRTGQEPGEVSRSGPTTWQIEYYSEMTDLDAAPPVEAVADSSDLYSDLYQDEF
jgi:hypothetical protein